MAGNSLPRRLVKKFVVPFTTEGMRQYLQAAAMIKDFRDSSLIKTKEPEALWAREHIKPGETAIDVGANFGLYTYHLSKAVGDTGKVISFEPIPTTAATLRKVCRLLRLKNISIVEKGCSNKSGILKFSVPLQDNETPSAGLAFLSAGDEANQIRSKDGNWQKAKEAEAEVVRLDDFLSDLTGVSLIKIDIEGADLFALQGALNTIRKFRPAIIMEVDLRWIRSYDISADDISEFFRALEYETYQLIDGTLCSSTKEEFHSNNRVFLPKESQRWTR